MKKETFYLNNRKINPGFTAGNGSSGSSGANDLFGVLLRDGSVEELLTPVPLKDLITNESYEIDGMEVHPHVPAMKDRTVTLLFYVAGISTQDYYRNYIAFLNEIQSGVTAPGGLPTGIAELKIVFTDDILNKATGRVAETEIFNHTFRLVYRSCQKYAPMGDSGGLFEVQFLEPAPTRIVMPG